mmetsp:Transcript_11203/g.21370  ORF Transcript_11203/g.21370 Transcript_11203/m.21370 type:complete len:323 (+) Transcript_11203:706-1674(+)
MLNNGGSNPAPTIVCHGLIGPLSPVKQNLSSCLLRVFDVADNLFIRRLVDDGSHHPRIRPRLNFRCLFDYFPQKLVLFGPLSNGEKDRRRHASLSSASRVRHDNVGRGPLNVAVRQGYKVVFGPAEGRDTFIEGAATVGNNGCYGRGSHKCHGTHILVINESLDCLPRSLHHVEHAVWNSRLLHQFSRPSHRQRHLFARLEHDRIPHDECDGHRPLRNHEREVERHNTRDNAQRIASILAAHLRADLEGPALGQLREGASVLDGFVALRHVREGLCHVLPVLEHNELGELRRVLPDESVELEHDGCAGFDGARGPGGEGCLG